MDALPVLRRYVIPCVCPKTNSFSPPATVCRGRRGYGSACTHPVPKSWVSPTR